jgi:RNA polymerase sigma factor (TIGR02999 family)
MSPPPQTSPTVTKLLSDLRAGRIGAFDELLPLLYDELRRLALAQLRRERPDHTLQPTALVHEAYLRLVDQNAAFDGRAHFMSVAALAMRRILTDHARRRSAAKREGGKLVTFDETVAASPDRSDEILAVDEALERLAKLSPRQARLVELRYFVGLSIEEAAEALDISAATAKRDWAVAKSWLQRELAYQAPMAP